MARRNHKERSQPVHRARLGLLEKHKDYVHRARDYKSKQDRIRKLREKAAFRNKDEFYWGMVKGKTKNGIAIADRGNVALDMDVVKILKSQDLGYVKVQIAKDEKKITRLRAELEITAPVAGPSSTSSSTSEWDAAAELAEVEKLAEMGIILRPQEGSSKKGKGKGKAPAAGHVIFADDKVEFENYGHTSGESSEEAVHNEQAIDLGWSEPSSSKKKKEKAITPVPVIDEEAVAEEAREHRMELLTLLSAYLARLKLLRQAESKLETTKGLMGKGAATKIRESQYVEDETVPENKNGERTRLVGKMWKWKLERRR
ncbi:uncharacterized protein IL334_003532 [Kwoniella shivajii]|uniref:U3 small nucleolar RNA-associated protein 11 n=1 Tax=Kwoniella shivajii TaxID=564305 RepID=A0ABZ1CXU4_9TREE|nr:hypothetical protein IL334_003532 [Kwoniella shivajii]